MNKKFQGNLFTVFDEQFTTPAGKTVTYERVRRTASVVVVPFLDDDTLILLHEYRITNGRRLWRLPTGRVDKENVDVDHILDPKNPTDLSTLKDAAQRELREEAGFRANSLEHYADRFQGESIKAPAHIFVAKNLTKDPLPQEEDEDIQVETTPFEKAYNMALSGEIEEELMALTIIRLWYQR